MKKNILVLNYEFPPLGGGASPVSYEISKGYVDLGYNVDVVTMGFKELPSYEVLDGINVYRVKCLRTKKSVCHPWEQLTYLYSGYKKIKELLKTKKYDICHTHFIIPTGVLALKLKKEFGINYIITAHGSDVLGHNPRFSLLYKILKKPWKNIINNSKMIISPSQYLRNKIESVTGKIKNIVVIPNGITQGKFKPLKKEKYILIVSRLQKSKGVQDVLDAMKYIDLGEWKIKIVGEGPYKSELEKLVINYSLKGKVEFIGWVENNSDYMKELYGKASIFCQPSYFESFGLTLLEAMQSGCLIFSRNIPGFEGILDENNSKLFNDIEGLTVILSEILNKTDFGENYKNIGVEFVKKYEWNNIIPYYNEYL